jgi:type VI secretion system protein ImpH
LPIHATEIAHDRKEHRKDTTLVDFLDIFQHRWMTLFYRAWASSQAAAGLDRPAAESFSRYVGLLSGTDPGEVAGSPLAVHARLAAAAHHIREARNPDGLTSTLAHFFGFRVRMEEFILHWMTLEPAERTYLGKPGPAATLGGGSISGEKVPDRQHKFRLVLGPLDMAQYLRLIPGGRDLPVLIEWVRSFVGFEYVWEIELRLKPRVAPPPLLGSGERLGWSIWFETGSNDDTPAVGMLFEPERYASSHPTRSSLNHAAQASLGD